jgi:hypothetical protein
VPLVLDLRIAHDRVGSSADPTLNGHLKYPNNLDQSLNDAATEKIRKYRADYNSRPPSTVSFMPTIASTSGRLHRLLSCEATTTIEMEKLQKKCFLKKKKKSGAPIAQGPTQCVSAA